MIEKAPGENISETQSSPVNLLSLASEYAQRTDWELAASETIASVIQHFPEFIGALIAYSEQPGNEVKGGHYMHIFSQYQNRTSFLQLLAAGERLSTNEQRQFFGRLLFQYMGFRRQQEPESTALAADMTLFKTYATIGVSGQDGTINSSTDDEFLQNHPAYYKFYKEISPQRVPA